MSNQQTFDAIVTLAGLYLIFKQRTAEAWYSFLVGANTALETYDDLNQDNGICDGTLLCTRVNARHKKGCLAKW